MIDDTDIANEYNKLIMLLRSETATRLMIDKQKAILLATLLHREIINEIESELLTCES